MTGLYPHIFISLGSCAFACILAYWLPNILMFVCTCLYPRILTSSYLQAHIPCFYPCILISSGWAVLACILASSHPHILRVIIVSLYTRILACSYSQIQVCFLVSLHRHILIVPGSCVLVGILASSHPRTSGLCVLASIPRLMCACSHRHVNMFLIQLNNCIFASSSSLCKSVCKYLKNPLDRSGFLFELLPHEQEILSETAIESQSKKKLLLKSRQNL